MSEKTGEEVQEGKKAGGVYYATSLRPSRTPATALPAGNLRREAPEEEESDGGSW